MQCVENISRSNCPVCLGDIHTSRYPCHIPDCGHLLHKTCFDQLVWWANKQSCFYIIIHWLLLIYVFSNNQQLASGHYVCPTCQTSMIDMKKLWDYLDAQAQNLPVPKSQENNNVNIFCNDCFKVGWTYNHSIQYHDILIFGVYFQQSTVKFHFIGLKCACCGGYNTTKNIKSRTFSFPSSKGNHESVDLYLKAKYFQSICFSFIYRQSINVCMIFNHNHCVSLYIFGFP